MGLYHKLAKEVLTAENLNMDIVCIILNEDSEEYVCYYEHFSDDEPAYDMIEK